MQHAVASSTASGSAVGSLGSRDALFKQYESVFVYRYPLSGRIVIMYLTV